MRSIIALAFAISAHSAAAETLHFDMTFEKEFFQDVFLFDGDDIIDRVEDGSQYGFEGAFSNLAPGAAVSAVVELDDNSGFFEVVSCEFAGLSCGGEFVEKTDTRLSLMNIFAPTISFNMAEGTATFFADSPGGSSQEGQFRSYGAEFAISEVPLPMPAALLLTGVLGFTALRRRKS